MESKGKELRWCKICQAETVHNVISGDNCVAKICQNCTDIRKLIDQHTHEVME